MIAFDLDDIALIEFLWGQKRVEVSVDDILKKIRTPRFSTVWQLQKLEKLGHGKFIIGRRGSPSRFVKSGEKPAYSTENNAPASSNRQPPALEGTDTGVSADVQVLVLTRDKPFRFIAPFDLTKAEAEKVSRWLELIAV